MRSQSTQSNIIEIFSGTEVAIVSFLSEPNEEEVQTMSAPIQFRGSPAKFEAPFASPTQAKDLNEVFDPKALKELIEIARNGDERALWELYYLDINQEGPDERKELRAQINQIICSFPIETYLKKLESSDSSDWHSGIEALELFFKAEHPDVQRGLALLSSDPFMEKIRQAGNTEILYFIADNLFPDRWGGVTDIGPDHFYKIFTHPIAIDLLVKEKNDEIHDEPWPNKIFRLFKRYKFSNFTYPAWERIDLTKLIEQANSDNPETAREAHRILELWVEIGHHQGIAESTSTRGYRLVERDKVEASAYTSCRDNPFCFKGFSVVPYASLGYEAIYAKGDVHHLFNPRHRLYFHNQNKVWGLTGEGSLGIGPDIQGHFGENRNAFSAGMAIRAFGAGSGSGGFALGFVELSLRGGAGELNVVDESNVTYSGNFHFIAGDAILSALGLYFGGGFRKEFWPQGISPEGEKLKQTNNPIYPALIAGFGLL